MSENDEDPDGRTIVRPLFSSRPFRNIVAATFASTLGDWMGFLAIIALTGSILGPTRAAAFAVSGVMTARVLPSLLLGPVAGVFVDRWDRKRVMIATDIGRGVVMALIPFTDEVLSLVLATLVIELLSAMFAPAKDAVFPTLVRRSQLVEANQVNLVVTYGTLPLAGFVYALLVEVATRVGPAGSLLDERPMALPIWVNAASFLVSAVLIAVVPLSRRPTTSTLEPGGPGVWSQFREGLEFIGRHPIIRPFVLGVMVAAAGAGVVITVGEFFAGLIGAGPSGFGVLVAIVGTGLVGGLLAAAPMARRVGPERLFAPAILVAGAALCALAASPVLVVAAVPTTLMGAATGVAFVVGYTVLQQRVDDDLRGRTFAAFGSGVKVAIFAASIGTPVTIGLVGREARVTTELADGTTALVYPYVFGGIRLTVLATGVLVVIGAALTWRALSRPLADEEARLPVTPVVRPDRFDSRRRRGAAGAFVVFEGGDGSGKSTQIARLAGALEAAGHRVLVTREPGGTTVGERVREVLLHGPEAMGARTEALLFAAARAQHVEEVILPALEDGMVVLSDRYADSSIAYQGAGRGLGEDAVAALNRWATVGLRPDLTVLLDVEPTEGLDRAAASGAHDRLEAAGTDFHGQAAASYRRRAAAEPARWLVLDAREAVDTLAARVLETVLPLLGAPVVEPSPASSATSAPTSAPVRR